MLLGMSKKSRPYILKRERPGFYEGEIAKVEEEIIKLTDKKKLDEAKSLISALTKECEEQTAHLEKYGSGVFHVINASKERLARKEFMSKATIGSITEDNSTEITTGLTGSNKNMAIQAFKEGFMELTNVWDMDKPEAERTAETIGKKDVDHLIDIMPFPDIQEIATVILGDISEEDKVNLK